MLSPARHIDQLDATFEKLLDDALFAVVETELTPERRRRRRKEADACDLAFAKTYFPKIFDLPFTEVHRHIAGLKRGNHGVSGFRRSGKSAITHIAKAIKPISLGSGGIVCIANRTDDKATARTKSLSRIIQKNTLLCYDYGIEVVQDAGGHHIFKSEGGHTHLVAGSVNVGLRSITDDDFKRIRYAIGDDLYDKETVRSEMDNERVYNWIVDELWGQMEDDGLSIILGNDINDDCPIQRLKRAYPAQCFSFPIRDEEGRSAWPERYTDADLDAMEAEIPFDVWQSQYMCSPAEKGDIFEPEWLRSVNVALTTILASITAVDPSYGESPDACFKAGITGGITDQNEVVVLDIYLRRENYQRFFDYLDGVRSWAPAHKAILFENDFSQWAFAEPYYQQWMERRMSTLPIVMFSAKSLATQFRAADKESRILNLVHPHQTGQFLYEARVTKDGKTGERDFMEYRKQFLSFGKSKKKLDGLDAAATLYIMLFRYKVSGTFTAVTPRKRERPSWERGGFH